MEKGKIISIGKKIIPYILLLLFSLLGTYLVFYKGINTGDDYRFHFANIIEQYETLLEKKELSPISGMVAMGLGTGTRLFYSPLPHLTVTLLSLFMRLYNVSIFGAYKIVIVTTVFLSGVFMYRFAMHFTKENKIASLLAAACFVLYPYRLFDAFCRLAFAEAYSIMFLPLFFMGLYDIVHFKDKITTLPFLEIILGGALLFLSHNITALYAYLAGILYLICNVRSIIQLLKNKKYILYCGVAIFLLAGIGSIAFMSQFELMGTGLYNLSDRVRMWTNVETVITRTSEEFDYSGFLNIPYLTSRYGNLLTTSSLIIGIFMYLISCVIFIILDTALAEVKKLKYFHTFISCIVLFGLVSLISRRIEIYLGTIIFFLLYLYVFYQTKVETIVSEEKDKFYYNSLFWYSLAMIIVLFVMMEAEWVWEILPSFMLNIQFPWRLWALVQLYVAILVGIISHYVKAKNIASFALSILVGLLMVTNMPLIEKRMDYETNHYYWVDEVDESLLDSGVALGFNKEYCPQVFFDSSYRSEYSNSLYYKIAPKLPYNFDRYEDYYYDPVILDGKGIITVKEAFSPQYEMNISISTENALIQMPLIYYPGYEITAIDKETGLKIKVKGENVDGLVSFSLPKGYYEVTTQYVQTTIRKISIIWFSISLAGTSIILVYALFFEKKRGRKNEN